MALNSAQLIGTGLLDGFRNRIINGDMRIFQRNVAATAHDTYSVDRWIYSFLNTTGTVSVNQSTATPTPSGTVPAFTNSIVVDVTGTDATIDAGDIAVLSQRIEGLNVADLGWGTAGAKTVTLSFWVKATPTGTYGVSFRNGANDRSYVATYTVNTAATWEYKTITVPGDTSGTWLTTSGMGLRVSWSLVGGSNTQTTAGSWGAGQFTTTSAQPNLFSSATNELLLTGVQLEVGSVATEFERRNFGQEFAFCQRYYQRIDMTKTPTVGDGTNGANVTCRFTAIQTMRDTPTGSIGGTFVTRINGTDSTQTSQSASGEDPSTATVYIINQNIGGTPATYSSSTQIKTGTLILSSEL